MASAVPLDARAGAPCLIHAPDGWGVGGAVLVITLPLVVTCLALGDSSVAALRTLAIVGAVPSLTALVAFLRKLQRARAEDGGNSELSPVGERAPTHRSP